MLPYTLQPKETPADELPQPDNANAEVIPDAAQMEHILELPKATCLLLSLAKNAGLSANSSSELTYKGKEFLDVTGLCIDKDICEYGTNPALTFYDASGAKIVSYNETQLRKMVTDAAAQLIGKQ